MFIEKPATKRSFTKRKPVYGVGTNDAEYITGYMDNGKLTICPFYTKWVAMLQRCYDVKYSNKNPTYIGCYVCDDWLSFSWFKGWMENQDWQGKDLDKDILNQGNKIYSPMNCLFVPKSINTLLNIRRSKKGNLPYGVSKSKSNFTAQCSVNGKRTQLGSFETAELAFERYKDFKYKLIADVAKDQEEPLKSALLNYKVK
tara:strand:- start:1585 stop:2184 length:600 start_codon:yes stop_codon:yes gene_type:complete